MYVVKVSIQIDAFCRVEDTLVCSLNETKMDTVVSVEDGVKDMGERMEVGLHNNCHISYLCVAQS